MSKTYPNTHRSDHRALGPGGHAPPPLAPSDRNVHPPVQGLSQSAQAKTARQRTPRAVVARSPLSPKTTQGIPHQGGKQRKPHYSDASAWGTRKSKAKKRAVAITSSLSPVMSRWRDLDKTSRLRAVIQACGKQQGWVFSLNLSIGRESGTLHNEDPKRSLAKRLNEALNKHGLRGLPIAFVIEAERVTGRVHLHGVLVPGSHARKTIERALAQAGGKLKGQRRTRQCKIGPFRDPGPDGWHRYITEDLRFTSRHVRGDLTYISQPLIRLGQSYYDEVIRGGPAANTTSGTSSTPPPV